MSEPTAPRRLVQLSLLVTLVTSVMLSIFAWPVVRAAPRNVPVALVAPPPAVQLIQQRVAQARPGAFDLRRYDDERAARQAILDREVYGALIVTPTGPRVLTASAASPAVAQMLGQFGTAMASHGAPGAAPHALVEDVAPATSNDPRQAGLAASALPLVLAGLLSAVLLGRNFKRAGERIAGVTLVALLSGFTVTAILHGWFGTLAGSYWLNSLVTSLGIGAIAASVLGLESMFGTAGLATGAATMVLIGNPFSALASAPELLPGSWGAIGQTLPPGAFGSLLRSVAFFDGRHALAPTIVLLAWVTVGVSLIVMGAARARLRASTQAVPAVAAS